ncbi:MAG TPA: ribosome recycling factor [Candidatus Paceibacterota bacterium]|jgi:ribosome recycling factor|nr:ribosome recycling factor [Parcubacteria group bacterium]MDP6119621.1 ribosome recycling factor [Candidatus Paceibacterota bacterium]HJN62623.1 ribosome recycling factor [Candidatus Paceibacterota bacterium]|tara:strand:+ start:821 stop:1372 length:552 start_codon:yes stop_codon:yes gene_type:complete
MDYDFSNFEQKIKDTEKWLSSEFLTIRTGRATPTILDSISVDSYGTKVPIKQVASITIEDARTLRVSPWNTDQITNLEKAITEANLGLSVSVDEKGLRAIFPELTTERRETLTKLAKEKSEKARITVRGERDEVWGDIQEKQKKGELSEDGKFKLKEEMQKIVDEINKEIDEMLSRKEEEIKN